MCIRDVVVVGSSMGGIEALSTLASLLPGDLPAALLVTQHTSPESPGHLAQIISSRSKLRAIMASDGMELEAGAIYIAPPDRHMIVRADGQIGVVFGPRENRARPAVDPLFRSAAVHCRSRVIGVILTGLLGDGAAGLAAVRRCGGLAIVQSPDEAAYADMPERALAIVPDARVLTISGIAAALPSLVLERPPEPPPVPRSLRIEVELTERPMNTTDDWSRLRSESTDLTCPDCGGALRHIENGSDPSQYRCRVGHAFSVESLVTGKDEKLEEALWIALQTLKERAQLLEQMASEERRKGRDRAAEGYESRGNETRGHTRYLMEALTALRG